jgi:hypothetical protein
LIFLEVCVGYVPIKTEIYPMPPCLLRDCENCMT